MSNFSTDEKDKIILLEHALRERNKEIKRLQEMLIKAANDYNYVNAKVRSLKKRLESFIEHHVYSEV